MKKYKPLLKEVKINWQDIYKTMARNYKYGSGIGQELRQGWEMYHKKYSLLSADHYGNEAFDYLCNLVYAHSPNYDLTSSDIKKLNDIKK